ncbi:hypothetical protein MICAK_1020015 [Microcystis aeruginosa PCC 9701]|uniref:Uncharacterized protein n=1 Tax=Microcystis aeruginosa PCC 9701 TaxID=721123 RepID=I4IKB5_MICAE|nr:hypothetical protein MICAK_1020015 [Microcystis aeruginosa PCC 9701]
MVTFPSIYSLKRDSFGVIEAINNHRHSPYQGGIKGGSAPPYQGGIKGGYIETTYLTSKKLPTPVH